MAETFSGLKPETPSYSGLMVSDGVAARRVVDTHQACICFSFLVASKASDLFDKI